MISNDPHRFDELWRDKLQDFGEDPDDGLAELIQAKKNRMLRWYKISPLLALLAVIGLLGTATYLWMTRPNAQTNTPSNMLPPAHPAPEPSGAKLKEHKNAPSQQLNNVEEKTGTASLLFTTPVEVANPAVTKTNIPMDGTAQASQYIEAHLTADGQNTSTTNAACVADFDFYISYNGEANFLNTSIVSGNLKMVWDMGDGLTSTESYPARQFSANGVYPVSLSFYAGDKLVCATSKQIPFNFYSENKQREINGTIFEDRYISPKSLVTLMMFKDEKSQYEQVDQTRADESGKFSFKNLNTGKYLMIAQKPDNTDFFITYSGDVVNPENARPIVISETSFNDEFHNINLVRKNQTQALLSDQVKDTGLFVLILDQFNQVIAKVKTDGSGKLILEEAQLPPGDYQVLNPANNNTSRVKIGSGSAGTSGRIENFDSFNSLKNAPVKEVKLIPNPATNDVHFDINMTSTQNITVKIINSNGIEVYSEIKSGATGINPVSLMIENLPPGVYYIMVQCGTEQPTASRLIKR